MQCVEVEKLSSTKNIVPFSSVADPDEQTKKVYIESFIKARIRIQI
jgi:hypothetical protein